MKFSLRILVRIPLLLLACGTVAAAITIPGISGTPVEGIDGVLSPPRDGSTVTIDLSEALPGAWDSAPAPGTHGVYDAEKWAVVFKYSSVDLPFNGGVQFKNNASRAPVVWLVSGDVTIRGTLSLRGAFGSPDYPEPGPGGFRGGSRSGGGGMGPGGGGGGLTGFGPASHQRALGDLAGPAYGDPEVRNLIGGSGGGGRSDGNNVGSAGGGAILIIATGRITIDGVIQAGGALGNSGGSGGTIRLVASKIEGTGILTVEGATGNTSGITSSPGFIRLEAEDFGTGTISIRPPEYSVATISEPAQIWPDSSAPRARIVSVANLAVPADPKSALASAPTDVNVPANGPRQVRIETRNFPTSGAVTLFVTPVRGDRTQATATLLPGGNNTLAFWETTLDPALTGRVALQVRAAAE